MGTYARRLELEKLVRWHKIDMRIMADEHK